VTAASLPDLLADRIAAAVAALGRPLVVGLTGPQGSGKSTLAAVLAERVQRRGLTAAMLALDDLYLPKADRQRLAREVHPLLATRGVPGTHDVGLGLEVLAALQSSGSTRLPRFDKGTDERLPTEAWPAVASPVDVVLFEG
jgi:D-glycerate 3-kinase